MTDSSISMRVLLRSNEGGSGTMEQTGDSSSALQEGVTPHESRLYADETIYTLRFPVGSDAETLNLGNTAHPVLIRKRGGIPSWDDEQDSDQGWSREIAPGWR
jgi:hypothetical protein